MLLYARGTAPTTTTSTTETDPPPTTKTSMSPSTTPHYDTTTYQWSSTPGPFVCESEGKHPDPVRWDIFHQCVAEIDGSLVDCTAHFVRFTVRKLETATQLLSALSC